jgi:hypothetical protein
MSETEEMWDALGAYQWVANRHGFGLEWAIMCANKTQRSIAQVQMLARDSNAHIGVFEALQYAIDAVAAAGGAIEQIRIAIKKED